MFQNPQAMFQPGFAGTNPQQVRQDIAQDGGFRYAAQQAYGQPVQAFGGQQQAGLGAQAMVQPIQPFGGQQQAWGLGAQAMFQPGFAGTNPQQVRQDIARDSGFRYGAQQAYGQPAQAFGGQQQAGLGAQAMFQPGFAGTNPQQVRQDIAQDGGFRYAAQQAYGQPAQAFGGQQQAGLGAQAMLQPGFAGTNPQQVRQDIARDGGFRYGAQQAYGQPAQAFGGQQQAGLGAQAMLQPGFAGTNPQQVRQDIAQEGGFRYGAQQAYGQPAQAFGGQQQAGLGPQAMFQPGFAGTNPQQVRQDIAQDVGYIQ
ncbi:hypothetical protein [Effusibacillus pohliae]|uniref:hypothetical protein n=1 Tax=Effusibacillus pohliae TaxID=232270 RepID=UPI0003709710|nr:hypothetical protein [Effusibacillus pohliae]